MSSSSLRSFEIMMHELFSEMAKKRNDDLKSGFKELDSIINGFRPGELIIIAARPGMGKTSFALNIAGNICRKNKIILFSLEMSCYSLACRILASMTKIPLKKLINKTIDERDKSRIQEFTNQIPNFKLFVDDSSYVDFVTIKDEIKSLGNIDLIIVDYLQLIDTGPGVNRVMEITKLTRNFKNLARELNIPIILLSQLSRACESRQDKRPTMSDLRDSGSIEQDADKVMLIYRPGYYFEKIDPEDCEIIVAKNRSGDTGVVNIKWYGQYSLFEDVIETKVEDEKSTIQNTNFNQINF